MAHAETMTTPLWSHQQDALDFVQSCLSKGPGAAIFAGMGAGKSRVAIETVVANDCRKVLILGPKSVVRNVWDEQWSLYAPGWTCLSLGDGPVARRMETVKANRDRDRIAIVLNYDTVYRSGVERTLGSIPWDAIILDESHRIAKPSGKISRAVARLARRVPIRLALTGTPISNSQGPLAVYGQYRAVNPAIYQRTYTQFRDTYTQPCGYKDEPDGFLPPRGGGVPQPWKFANLDDLETRMASIAYRIETAQALDLPGETDLERVCDLEPSARTMYRELEHDLITDIEAGVVSVTNALTRLLRLQQLSGGWLKTDEGIDERVSTAKSKLLADVMEDLPRDEPLVVFCRFRKDLDTVAAVCAAARRPCYELSGRRDDLRRWKSVVRSGPVIAVQIQAGGLGISLVEAHTAVWYSLGYSLTDYEQARARLHRPGQSCPVSYIHLLTRGTVDAEVYQALASRADLVAATLAGLLAR
jgi:SNF2 family DNA or RNA helicase